MTMDVSPPTATPVLTVRLPDEYQVSSAELAALIESLNVDEPARRRRGDLLQAMNGWHWGRKLSDRDFASHGESLKLLAEIAASADSIVKAHDRIQPDFAVALELTRRKALVEEPPTAPLPWLDLRAEVIGLADAAGKIQAKLSTRNAHRPARTPLYDIVEQLVRELEAMNITVATSRTLSSVNNPHLSGPGGELIMRFFARIDPQITSAALYRIVRKLRSERTAAARGIDKSTDLPS